MAVVFDKDNKLGPGQHHVVTHAQITYFENYVEDAQGQVTNKGTFYSEPLETMTFHSEVPGCSNPLGMKSKEIHDYQISASSSYAEAQPSQARELDDGWCAKNTKGEQYLQIEFLQKTRVTGLVTIRRQSKPHWVIEYFVMYSTDSNNWRTYTENGFKKLFQGNTISFTPTKHWLANAFEAMTIRIIPTKWEILICLRLELYGCLIKGSANNCISPLGMESGEITDEALSDRRASVDPSHGIQPKNARLNAKITKFPNGWESTIETEYLQVDFGSLRRVTKVATQGAYTTESYTLFFVSTYKLSYSKNKIDWTEYAESGSVKTFKGPVTEYDAKYPVVETIQSPFVARYVRLYPMDAGSGGVKVMRAELYGCFQEPLPPYTGSPDLEFYRRSFIVDSTTDQFYVCMYTDNRDESSCFSTKDSKAWTAIDANIIGMLASNPRDREIYAIDRQMNIYRSKDSGASWSQISREYY
ncbi:lactadherin-like [Actinia tenebrosa]|uniref:Lactadherin-like n=1 Tax=Actinia tenebrosa TaxID=6105 RepID=A0A6P8H8I9_ACTTE|nr:lactadherin-like [Actinia tenebrosa]